MNNSSIATKPEPLKIHIISIIVGVVIFLCNILVLLVFLTNRPFLKQSALLFGVTIGNLAVAIGSINSESYRLYLAITDQFYSPVSAAYCLMTTIPTVNAIAYNWPGIVLAAIGIERLVALSCPAWYHCRWSHVHNWYALLGCILLLILNVLSQNLASLWMKPNIPVVAHCSYSSLFPELGAVSFYCTVIVGLAANLCTLVAFCVGRRHLSKMSQHQADEAARRRYQKQLRIGMAMLSMASLDFVLVVVPNSIFALNYFVHINIPESVVLWFIFSYEADAVLNMVVQFVFNSDFRKAAMKLLRLERFCLSKNAIAPNDVPAPPT